MSSQLVTIPCSIGYFRVRIPRLDWASSPTYSRAKGQCPYPRSTCISGLSVRETHIRVLLTHANHHTLVLWAADNRREDSTRGIVSCETGLAHAAEGCVCGQPWALSCKPIKAKRHTSHCKEAQGSQSLLLNRQLLAPRPQDFDLEEVLGHANKLTCQ